MTEVAESNGTDERLTFDLGNMAVFDKHTPGALNEVAIQGLATETVQQLVAQLFDLDSRKADEGRLAVLPPPTTVIPREKPPPKEKPLSKWEQFRKEKGLKKRKKDGRVFDEEKQMWVATHGAHRRQLDRKMDWLRELPDNYQPLEEGGDAFLDDQIRRRERVQKQKKQELANIKRSRDDQQSAQLASTAKKIATASMGKFDSFVSSKKLKPRTSGAGKPAKRKTAMKRRKGK